MDDVVSRLNEKLASAVQRLRDGNYDDHDILPGLLWTLLEFNRSNHDKIEHLREAIGHTSEGIGDLVKILKDECEKLRRDTSQNGEDIRAKIGSLIQAMQEESDKHRSQIGSLTQALQEESDKLRSQVGEFTNSVNENLNQNSVELQKLVETKVDKLNLAHQVAISRTDNRLKWIVVGSISQILLLLASLFLFFAK